MEQVQIRSRINQLNSEKQGYIRTKNSYKTSLEYANKLLTNLSDTKKSLDSSYDNLKRYFTLNNVPVENKQISNTMEKINQLIKKLNNSIIPSINSNIRTIENKISSIESEIARLNSQLNKI